MNPPDHQYSSSDDSSDGEESLSEDEVEVEGNTEMILVPRKSTRTQELEAMPEEALGGVGLSSFFTSIVSSLAAEDLIKRSPRGKAVGELLKCIEKLDSTTMAVMLLTEVGKCLGAGRRHKLPSLKEAAVWTAFHKLRSEADILHAWNTFIAENVPADHQQESELAVQLLMDRALRKMIGNLSKLPHNSPAPPKPLTTNEANSVRYMAGYVAVKLLKKYQRSYKNPRVHAKHKLFVAVLDKMKAQGQPGSPDSVLEYSTLWMELIDRGGLYNINDDVFQLFMSIELVVRKHMNVPELKESFVPGTAIASTIREEVMGSDHIMELWEKISDFSPRYEKYSIELFTLAMELWISIRGHSFAKGCRCLNFDKHNSASAKGTRKSLKPKEKTKE